MPLVPAYSVNASLSGSGLCVRCCRRWLECRNHLSRQTGAAGDQSRAESSPQFDIQHGFPYAPDSLTPSHPCPKPPLPHSDLELWAQSSCGDGKENREASPNSINISFPGHTSRKNVWAHANLILFMYACLSTVLIGTSSAQMLWVNSHLFCQLSTWFFSLAHTIFLCINFSLLSESTIPADKNAKCMRTWLDWTMHL